jgi:glycosyltransferase involved in cell wall biosynthesis
VKLALLGPIAWRTPPRHYGPWELVTGLLADGLVARGVDVTLFATLDSVTQAELDGVCPRPYEEDTELDGRVYEALHVAHALHRSAEFDLIHNNLDWLPLAFSGLVRAPMVTTIHGFSSPRILPAYRSSRSAFVSISEADRSPELSYVATVHHGVDPSVLPFSPSGSAALVCFGRIHPDKGTAEAVEIAHRAGRPLVLCGPVQDERYFAEHVKPHVDGDRVRYLGSVGPPERAAVLGGAACLLHPISFAESFGLSVVEAMLCGTPVVATDLPGVREAVRRTGMGRIVPPRDPDALAAALLDVLRNRPAYVRPRAAVAAEFDLERSLHEYEKLFEAVRK